MRDQFDELAARVILPRPPGLIEIDGRSFCPGPEVVDVLRAIVTFVLRQADVNARAFLAPAQTGATEAGEFSDAERDEIRRRCAIGKRGRDAERIADVLSEIRARRANSAAPEKPILTEWRDEGTTHSKRRRVDGRDDCAVIANGPGTWWVQDADTGADTVAEGKADTLKASKRAADEAARQWYTLPDVPATPPSACRSGAPDFRSDVERFAERVHALDVAGKQGMALALAAAYQRAWADVARVVRDRIPASVGSDFDNGAKQALESLYEALQGDAARTEADDFAAVDGECVDEAARIVELCKSSFDADARVAVKGALLNQRLKARTETPQPAEVLATVEARADVPPLPCKAANVAYLDGDGIVRVDLPVDRARVSNGQRVLVAVLTGPIAGIVERDRAREAFAEHVKECTRDCMFDRGGYPVPVSDCVDGQRLAAAVKAAGGAR